VQRDRASSHPASGGDCTRLDLRWTSKVVLGWSKLPLCARSNCSERQEADSNSHFLHSHFLIEATKTAAQNLQIALGPVAEVRQPGEFDAALLSIARARPHALAVLADRFLLAHRKQIVEFAAAHQLPSMYPYRELWMLGAHIVCAEQH
jgi:hypothetical protein